MVINNLSVGGAIYGLVKTLQTIDTLAIRLAIQ